MQALYFGEIWKFDSRFHNRPCEIWSKTRIPGIPDGENRTILQVHVQLSQHGISECDIQTDGQTDASSY